MAKTNRKNGNSFASPKSALAAKKQSSGASSGSGSSRPSTNIESVGRPAGSATLNHQQIEDRAREIWQKKGCPAGQDDKNWQEAESQLKQELGIR